MAEAGTPPRFDIAALLHVRRSLLVTLVTGLLLLVVLATLPPRPLIFHVLQKLAHPVVFGVVALALLVLQRQRAGAPARPPALEYMYVLIVATGLGGFTEIGQFYTHRDPALRDVWLDARGAACALAFAAAFDLRCRAGVHGRRLRRAYFAIGALLALVIFEPLAWVSAAYANRVWHYPVLFAPHSSLDLYFVTTTDHGAKRTPLEARWASAPGERTLRVTLLSRPQAGFFLEEPSSDWGHYRTLLMDLVNPGKTPLELALRVNDRAHSGYYSDRYNARYTIPPGTRQLIEIPLASIRDAPSGRSMDLAHITNVGLLRVGEGGPRELLLNRLELR